MMVVTVAQKGVIAGARSMVTTSVDGTPRKHLTVARRDLSYYYLAVPTFESSFDAGNLLILR